jgi:RHS repeat-associated protein
MSHLRAGYGQLITQYQAVAGSVYTSTTPSVQYGYSQPSGTNYSRQTTLTYPGGRVVDYNYNSGIDTTISRLSSMSDSGGNIESYSYLGLSTIVREVRPGSVLTYVKASGASNGDAGDMYTGLDRFGRVVNQLWVTADTVSSGTGGDTLGTTTEQFEYGYDQDSNVLYQDNMVHSADSELFHANSTTSGDDSTAYDPLNRLATYRRGTLSSSGHNGSSLDKVTSASGSNSYSLDALGNSTAGGTTFNSKNQITSEGDASITYDYDGNMTTDEEGNTYIYDAWNRMVYANLPGRTNESFTYNAGDERPGLSICAGTVTTSYYSNKWQDLEDDIVTPGPCGASSTTTSTYLWSEGYIDDLVARDSSVDGGSVTRIFAQQDANHDITSLVNSSGTVLERFVYDPYGNRTVLSASWASTTDGYDWVYGFQGGRLDPLTGLINFRNRDLNPTLGVWMEQDNIGGYVDGMNLYRAMGSNPVSNLDPEGTHIQFNSDDLWEQPGVLLYGIVKAVAAHSLDIFLADTIVGEAILLGARDLHDAYKSGNPDDSDLLVISGIAGLCKVGTLQRMPLPPNEHVLHFTKNQAKPDFSKAIRIYPRYPLTPKDLPLYLQPSTYVFDLPGGAKSVWTEWPNEGGTVDYDVTDYN